MRTTKLPRSVWVVLICVAVAAAALYAFRGKPFEGYVRPPVVSCYGAAGPNVICKTCNAVEVAFQKKGLTFDRSKIAQCGTPCYGARANDDCETCADVRGAYNARKWKFDEKLVAQCAKK